jgi:hypothetical protein
VLLIKIKKNKNKNKNHYEVLRNEPKLNEYDHFINVMAYQQTSNAITVQRRGVVKWGERKSGNEPQTSNA